MYVHQRAKDLGLEIVDSRERLLVTVTSNDVVNAKKANSKNCALARASLRLPDVCAAYFFRTAAYLEYLDRMVRYVLPVSVQKEIVSFDRARIFASGVYQLSPPPPTSARGKRSKRRLPPKPARGAAPTRAPGSAVTDQRDFERQVSGIIGNRAPLPLKQGERFVHRTQYVRDLNEPA